MNGLVAAIKFLLETVFDGVGATAVFTYSVQAPATPGTALGTMVAKTGYAAGYYTIRISDIAGLTADDDFVGTLHVTLN